MDHETEQQMLEELRTHTTLLTGVNRSNAIILVWLGVLIVLLAANLIFGDRISEMFAARAVSPDSWRDARRLVEKGDLPKAREMIGRLIAKTPRNFYGYRMMGFVEAGLGNSKTAETNFVRACELFPSEENEKNLEAIRKVAERDAPNHR